MAPEVPRQTKPVDVERLFGNALEVAEVAVLGFDADGRLAIVNKTAETMTGYCADELVGADPFARLFGERADAVRRRWLAAIDGPPVEIEMPLRTRADTERVVRWCAASPTEGPGSLALVVAGVDVTRQREFERLLRRRERLDTAGVLAAGLAHEIRNPLNGASLHLSVLERTLSRVPNVPAAAAEAISVLRTETKRLSALVTDFLDVARPSRLARAASDVHEIARASAALLEHETHARSISLKIEAPAQSLVAEVDAERIKLALVHLLENAVEATGEHGSVTLRVRRTPGHVEVDVGDDGPGIADPKAPIFDAFYTTKERGIGLGLSIVQRIVLDHGGDVVYTSRPGHTVFTIRLPLGGPDAT
jgi:PAS domain S-box-containing protein